MATAQRIAIVMHDFSTGGSERIAIRMANHWAASGRNVTILCGTMDGPALALVSAKVHVLPTYPQIRRSLLSRIRLGRALAQHVSVIKPDVIFAPGNFHIPVIATLAIALGRNRPPLICKLSNPLHRAISRLKAYHMDKIDVLVAMSKNLGDDAKAILPGADIVTIHEPILDDAFQSPPRVNRVIKPPLILCVGRLVAQKNFRLAVRAFAEIGAGSGARMLIAGEGTERSVLERDIASLGVSDRVTLAGHVPDISALLAKASLLLMTSRFEGYPAVLVEALAARVPVVTTDCSTAIPEVVSHPSFGKIADNDPYRIANAVENMIAYPPMIDERALTKLIEKHRLGDAAVKYLELFDRVVGEGVKDRAPETMCLA